MTRRDLLALMLGTAIAEAVDVERLLWTPRPIVTVPAPQYVPAPGDLYVRDRVGGLRLVARLEAGRWTPIEATLRVGDRLLLAGGTGRAAAIEREVVRIQPSDRPIRFRAMMHRTA